MLAQKKCCHNFVPFSRLCTYFLIRNTWIELQPLKSQGLGVIETWVHISAPPLTGCVTLGRLPNLSEPHFPHL